MAGTVKFIIRADTQDAAAKMREMIKLANDLGISYQAVGKEVEGSGNKHRSFGDQVANDMKRLVSAGGPVMAMYKAIQESIALVRQEWEAWQRKQDEAKTIGMDAATARNVAFAMAHYEKGLGEDWMNRMVALAGKQGVKPVEAWQGMIQVQSAVGPGVKQAQAEQAWELGSRMAVRMGTTIGAIAPSILDMMKATGMEAGPATALFFKTLRESRIQEPAAGAQTIPEMMMVGRQFGLPPALTAAMASVLTSEARDVSGEEATTAVTGLLRTVFDRPVYPMKELVQKQRTLPGGFKRATWEEQTAYHRIPYYITPTGEAPEEVNRLLREFSNAGKTGDMTRAGQLYGDITERLSGTRQTMPWKEFGPEADIWSQSQRDPLGAFLWVQKSVAKMSEKEQERWFGSFLARGKYKPLGMALLRGRPHEWELLLESYGTLSRTPEEYEQEMGAYMAASEGGIGGELITRQKLQAIRQGYTLKSDRYRAEGLSREAVKDFLENLRGKTALGASIDEFVQSLEMLRSDANPWRLGAQVLIDEAVVRSREFVDVHRYSSHYAVPSAAARSKQYDPEGAAQLREAATLMLDAARLFDETMKQRNAELPGYPTVRNVGAPPTVFENN